MTYKDHYTYRDMEHSKKIMAQIIYDKYEPQSIVDVGCGNGALLEEILLLDNDIKCQGYDYSPYIDYRSHGNLAITKLNLENMDDVLQLIKFNNSLSKKQFDLGICLEVAEHLDILYSSLLIDFLCSLSDTIIFSAALPMKYAKNNNHVNLQWPEYWQKLFWAHGFIGMISIRNKFLQNNVADAYCETILTFIHSPTLTQYFEFEPIRETIHRRHYAIMNNRMLKDYLVHRYRKFWYNRFGAEIQKDQY